MSKITNPTIYVRHLCEHCMHVRGGERDDPESLTFDGKPRASTWRPATIKFIDADEADYSVPVRRCDISGPIGGLILNEKARDVLEPHVSGYGELLPVKCDKGRYWAFNVTRLLDIFDPDASELLRGETGNILMVKKHVFRTDGLDGVLLFKVSQRPRGPIYFTHTFVQLVDKSGLTGLEFRRVWPHRSGDAHRWG